MSTLTIAKIPSHVRLGGGEKLTTLPYYEEKLLLEFGTKIPHFIDDSSGLLTMVVPSDYKLEVGDEMENEFGPIGTVTSIVERRKARGQWKDNPFDQRPDFIKVRFI